MTEAQAIDKPKRWDLPFSRDFLDLEECRDMNENDLARLLLAKPFSDMNSESFPDNLPLKEILCNDTRIRWYRHGDLIVRQGDYGNSAFLILSGNVRVIFGGLNSQAIGRRSGQRMSMLRSFMSLFSNPSVPEARDTSRYLQIQTEQPEARGGDERVFARDAVNLLATVPDAFTATKNDVMKAGRLFGELAALGRVRRAATVVADGEVELLEIRWQGLRDLRKNDPALRQSVDDQFRRHGMADALQKSPLLARLSEREVRKVADAAVFETKGEFDWYGTYKELLNKDVDPLSREPIIAEEGHYPNGLILIRAGFARLSRRFGHGERTFSYLGENEVYGLAELVHNARHPDEPIPLRSTLRAVGYADLVRIPTHIFEQCILPTLDGSEFPVSGSGPTAAKPETRNLKPENRSADVSLPVLSTPSVASTPGPQLDPGLLEFLVERRFINGTQTMMIKLDRCTRCDDCVRACASGHDNNPRFVRHGAIYNSSLMIANACMHCADPVCMIGCPTGAIDRNEEGGEVVINDLTCIGCSTCANSCPYDNIRMVEVRDERTDAIVVDPIQGRAIVKATKCDLCVDHHGGPACERACPHDALKRVDMRDQELLAKWLNR